MILKKLISTRQSLKAISLIFGYLFWLVLAQTQQIYTTTDIPLGFYNTNESLQIVAPENIKVTLQAKRIDLLMNDLSQVGSIQIDASKYFTTGEYVHNLSEHEILLHNKIKLVNYFSTEVTLQIKEKQ